VRIAQLQTMSWLSLSPKQGRTRGGVTQVIVGVHDALKSERNKSIDIA